MTTRTIVSASDPQYATPDNNIIYLSVVFEELKHLGAIPFAAAMNDVHGHGIELFERAIRGDFGPITPCSITADQMLITRKAALCKQIDMSAIKAHAKDTAAMSNPMYLHTLSEAREAINDPMADANSYPLLSALIGHKGNDNRAVSETICAEDIELRKRAADIEAKRLNGKKAVMAATSEPDANKVAEAIRWT
jgi:hypothetical protein